MAKEILSISDLSIHFFTDDGIVKALNNVSLTLHEGETLGLVGETGAGKTTLAKGIMRLTPCPPGKVVSGEIIYDGSADLIKVEEKVIRSIRGNHISMIFQDPMTSLNPVMTVGEQIAEVIRTHKKCSSVEAEKGAIEMLEMVGIPGERHTEYPHQFSGGMKQRVVIAIALACDPKILIADEPTTALDVTIQAQVLEMMQSLKKQKNTALLLITHDLGIVAQNCDRVAIMYAGEVVEYGDLHDIFKSHAHPYTEGLLGSIPNLNAVVRRLSPIEGLMPDPTNLPLGCAFCPRCKYAVEKCKTSKPELREIENNHFVRCFLRERET